MDKICDRQATEYVANDFESLVNKIASVDDRISQMMLEVNNLKNVVRDSSEYQKQINDVMEQIENMKEVYNLNMTEIRAQFINKLCRLDEDVDQLSAYIIIKDKEINALEALITHQNTYIDSYEKSMKRFEDYVTAVLPNKD